MIWHCRTCTALGSSRRPLRRSANISAYELTRCLCIALAAGLAQDDEHPFEMSMSSQLTTSRMHRAGLAAGFDNIFETNMKDPELMRSAGLDAETVSLIREVRI